MLANWRSKIAYQRISASATTDVKVPMRSIETPDKADSSYVASQQYAIRDDHPKYPALLIANRILGTSSLSSRLGSRVRQEEGLSYEIFSRFAASPIDERAFAFDFRKNQSRQSRQAGEDHRRRDSQVRQGRSHGKGTQGQCSRIP